MKKAGRIVAYLLAFAMFSTLFVSLIGKTQPIQAGTDDEASSDGQFVILEIVPDLSMRTVGYLVPDTAFEDYESDESEAKKGELRLMKVNGQSKSKNCLNTNFQNFLVGGHYGTFASNTYSSNYFVQNVLTPAARNTETIKLISRTPEDLKDADIAIADFIVINETVPSALQVGTATGSYTKHFYQSTGFTWDKAYKIFKKIAGVDCDPVPYVIDANLGKKNSTWDDVRKYNVTNPFLVDSKTNVYFSYITADKVDWLTDSDELPGGALLGNGSDNHQGSNKPSFKLFKLLSAINPATLYGLYFVYNDDSYGINPRNGNLITVGMIQNARGHVYSLDTEYEWWGDKYLKPYYMDNSTDTAQWDGSIGAMITGLDKDIMSKMGWVDSSTWNFNTEFIKKIGSKDGNGFVFNSAKSYFGMSSTDISNLAKMIKSYTTAGSKNDYHPYSYLVVTGHDGDDSVGTVVNRGVVADMVQYANGKDKGLVGGLRVEFISDLHKAGLEEGYAPEYDGIINLSNKKGSAMTSSDATTIFNAFKSDIDSASFGIKYKTLPVEYYTEAKTAYQEQNGAGYYPDGSISVDHNMNYINNDYNSDKRSLDFNFEIMNYDSAKTYTAKVYVDKDHDDVFEESERVSLSVKEGKCKDSVNLNDFVATDFVGGLAWKLEVSDGSDKVNRLGFSAIRKTKETKHSINVLQIYPTDYVSKYANDSTETGGIYPANPMLLIPTKDEVAEAGSVYATFKKNSDMLKKNGTKIELTQNFKQHFDGILKVDTCTKNLTSSTYTRNSKDQIVSNSLVSENQKVWYNAAGTSSKRNNVLINATLIQYYIDLLSDFDVNNTRYSVYGFNKAVDKGDIQYYEDSKKIGMPTGEEISNANGSKRYLYDPKKLKEKGKDLTDTVNWGGTVKKRYLVDDTTGKIYGERKDKADEYIYYGAKEFDLDGQAAEKNIVFDLVVLGFGSDMDYMSDNAIKVITDYIDNEGPAFVGNGVVTVSANNTLATRMASRLGMDTTKKARSATAPQIGEQSTMIINDTLTSNYPYNVPHYFKTTGGDVQQYQLNLAANPDIVVSYAKYKSQYASPAYWGYWGAAANNYYLYKKGNITFCGFGSTFMNEGQDQKGGAMSLAEDIMLVNALVTTSKFRGEGNPGKAYFDLVDVDRGVLISLGLEDDEIFKSDPKKDDIKQNVTDAVYTDYNSFGLSKTGVDDKLIFNVTDDKEALDSLSLTPDELIPSDKKDFTGSNIRWVPYLCTIADATYYLRIETPDGKLLDLDVYECSRKDKELVSEDPVELDEDVNGGTYKVKGNYYYIGIPLLKSDTKYTSTGSSSVLGFDLEKKSTATATGDQFSIVLKLYKKGDDDYRLVEEHTVTMVRRVLYPVD